MTKKEIELVHKIAQEAHTMGRIYQTMGSPWSPATEFNNVDKMVERYLRRLPEQQPQSAQPPAL